MFVLLGPIRLRTLCWQVSTHRQPRAVLLATLAQPLAKLPRAATCHAQNTLLWRPVHTPPPQHNPHPTPHTPPRPQTSICTPNRTRRSHLTAPQPCPRARRRRVARGSGRSERDVQELLGVFTNLRMQMQSFRKMMAVGGMGERARCAFSARCALLRCVLCVPLRVYRCKVQSFRKMVAVGGMGGRTLHPASPRGCMGLMMSDGQMKQAPHSCKLHNPQRTHILPCPQAWAL